MLQTIASWLGYVPKGATVAAPSLSVGITSDVGAVAGALQAGLNLGLTITEAKNTPAYLAAVKKQKALAAIDQIRKDEQAAESGDTAALQRLREDVS